MENRLDSQRGKRRMLRLAILASGTGSNLQSILNAADRGILIGVEPVLVVVDRSCGALELASAAGIETVLLDRKLPGIGLSAELARLLDHRNIEMVALAGWLSILDGEITERWAGKMINIHPSLLPLHGGPGMYGRRVHRAVLDAGDRESGCSVHLVTQGVDEGKVLGQTRVPVIEGDTPESLAGRILIEEHKLYPQVIDCPQLVLFHSMHYNILLCHLFQDKNLFL